jgi:hypothetical protein
MRCTRQTGGWTDRQTDRDAWHHTLEKFGGVVRRVADDATGEKKNTMTGKQFFQQQDWAAAEEVGS